MRGVAPIDLRLCRKEPRAWCTGSERRRLSQMGKGVLGRRDGGRECGGRRGRLVSGLREGSDRLDVARLRGGRVRVHVVRERAWRVEVALRLSGVACGLCRLVLVVVLDLRRWLLLAERDAREHA